MLILPPAHGRWRPKSTWVVKRLYA